MLEMFLNTLLKNIKIDDILNHPQVQDALSMARHVANDHKENKERLIRIENMLAALMAANGIDVPKEIRQSLPGDDQTVIEFPNHNEGVK